MSDLVEVTVTAEHKNSFGDAYKKAKGDKYSLPKEMATTLRKQGLVSIDRAKADTPAEKSGPGKDA